MSEPVNPRERLSVRDRALVCAERGASLSPIVGVGASHRCGALAPDRDPREAETGRVTQRCAGFAPAEQLGLRRQRQISELDQSPGDEDVDQVFEYPDESQVGLTEGVSGLRDAAFCRRHAPGFCRAAGSSWAAAAMCSTSCRRSRTPRFSKTTPRWAFTVRSEMNINSATSRLVGPACRNSPGDRSLARG